MAVSVRSLAARTLHAGVSPLFIAVQRDAAACTPTLRGHVMRSPFATVSNMLDKMDGLTNILSTDRYGFNVNGIHMRGSIIAFSNFTLLWNCLRIVDASPRNLAVVHSVKPKPEILVIGTGESMENVNPALYSYFSRKGISVEPMSTVSA